ncbi:MAG: dihydroorotase [Ruminococcaceae bacterium]|nr:dihydroorotase [Oscillospiraceae bacterium]
MKKNILIQNGRVIDPESKLDKLCDVYIENGRIAKIGENLANELTAKTEFCIIDATDKIVAPGLVDMHCHLREPGQEYKEDIKSGTRAAAKGGFTSVACMPNTTPPLDNAALIKFIYAQAAEKGCINVFPIGSISKGQKGEELAEIGDMKSEGAVAVSDDGRPVESPMLMRRALEYADMFDTLVISHCEDLSLVGGGSMNEGAVSTRLGLKGIPKAAEEVQVARDVILAGETGARLHLAHISTAGSVEIVRRAKAQGFPVTAETCPHYFTLTEEAVDGFNTNAKMNPPLRSAEDVEAIICGLADGTIDAIATDHAPHHVDEKNLEFATAANGIIGLETALALGVTYLVRTNRLTLSALIQKMTQNPAGILGITKGRLQEGQDADLVVFDITTPYTVKAEDFASKSKNSPYIGCELYGKVDYTLVGGDIVVEHGELL